MNLKPFGFSQAGVILRVFLKSIPTYGNEYQTVALKDKKT
jgi:hypothetical protein